MPRSPARLFCANSISRATKSRCASLPHDACCLVLVRFEVLSSWTCPSPLDPLLGVSSNPTRSPCDPACPALCLSTRMPVPGPCEAAARVTANPRTHLAVMGGYRCSSSLRSRSLLLQQAFGSSAQEVDVLRRPLYGSACPTRSRRLATSKGWGFTTILVLSAPRGTSWMPATRL